MPYHAYGFGPGIGFFGIGWIIMILVWILIIIGVVILIRWLIEREKNDGEKR